MSKNPCPDCAVKPGQPHEKGCDVARCVCCGMQALMHGYAGDHEGPPFCGVANKPIPTDQQVWTGVWPGVEECQEFGWYSHWTVVTKYSRNGEPDSGPTVRCTADHPHAHEDLSRLGIAGMTGELRWDRGRSRWVKPT